MQVIKILGTVATPQGNQVIAELFNGRYVVGLLSKENELDKNEQFEDFEVAFDKWYDNIQHVL
jgi:hypothetical protein